MKCSFEELITLAQGKGYRTVYRWRVNGKEAGEQAVATELSVLQKWLRSHDVLIHHTCDGWKLWRWRSNKVTWQETGCWKDQFSCIKRALQLF